jgi:hypothetical protein
MSNIPLAGDARPPPRDDHHAQFSSGTQDGPPRGPFVYLAGWN